MYSKIIPHLSSFEQSEALFDTKIKREAYKGDYIYNSIDSELYIVLYEYDANKLACMKLKNDDNDVILISKELYYIAWNVSELKEFIPNDYILPQRFEKGWAFTTSSGEIHVMDDFYDKEINVIIDFILFFVLYKKPK